jgi:NADH-quinone oxidoreductase subunit C
MTGVDWLGEQEALRKEAGKGKAAAVSAEETGASASGSAAAEPPLPEAEIKEDEIEVVYDFNKFQERHGVVLRVRTPRTKPEVPTIHHIYPIAHWHEREAHEFFGVVFTGHPYLVPLLLPEDADYHPLLKDFVA